MNYNLHKNNLTLYFVGKLTSDNLEPTENETNTIIETNAHEKLTIDMSDLEYISSAGLRLILKLSKKESNMVLCNVNSSVYEILSVTGFSEILKIEKTKKFVDLQNCKLIGAGYFSKVYRIDKDTIVKSFRKDTPFAEIENERNTAKQAFVAGFPCVIPYDIVNTNDGYGMIFEALNCGTLIEEIKQNDEDYLNKTIVTYADLIKTINSTEAPHPDLFPSANENALKELKSVEGLLDSDLYDKTKLLLQGIKNTNTFVHRDCHFGNIMRNNGELLMIDMDTLSIGNPIFDWAAIFCAYNAFIEFDAASSINFHKIPTRIANKIFFDAFHLYFKGKSIETIERNLFRTKFVAYAHLLYWSNRYKPELKDMFDFFIIKLKTTLPLVENLNFE